MPKKSTKTAPPPPPPESTTSESDSSQESEHEVGELFVHAGDFVAVLPDTDDAFWLAEVQQNVAEGAEDVTVTVIWLEAMAKTKGQKDKDTYVLGKKHTVPVESILCSVSLTPLSDGKFQLPPKEKELILKIAAEEEEEEEASVPPAAKLKLRSPSPARGRKRGAEEKHEVRRFQSPTRKSATKDAEESDESEAEKKTKRSRKSTSAKDKKESTPAKRGKREKSPVREKSPAAASPARVRKFDVPKVGPDPCFHGKHDLDISNSVLDNAREAIRAVITGNIELLRKVRENKTDICTLLVRERPDSSLTALHHAVLRNDLAMLKIFADEMCEPSTKPDAPRRVDIPDLHLPSNPLTSSSSSGPTANVASLGMSVMFPFGGGARPMFGRPRPAKMLGFGGGGDSDDESGMPSTAGPAVVKRAKAKASKIEKEPNHSAFASEKTNEDMTELVQFALQSPGVKPETIDFISEKFPNAAEILKSKVYLAVRAGNRALAAHIVPTLIENGGWGFNVIHKQCLTLNGEDMDECRAVSYLKMPTKELGNALMLPIHAACSNPNAKYIQKMMEETSKFEHEDDDKYRPIHYAAACEGTGPLNYLLGRDVRIHDSAKDGYTPLMIAVRRLRTENVGAILAAAKAKGGTWMSQVVDAKMQDGRTALHLAAQFGHTEAVKLLIANGAKLDAPDNLQRTPLLLAAAHGCLGALEVLLEKGAQLAKADKYKKTAAMYAARNGHAHVLHHLLSLCVSTDARDSSKNTALHFAASFGWEQCVNVLLQAGASVNPTNEWMITPLALATMNQHLQCVKALCEKNANPNIAWNTGDTPLLHVARHYSLEGSFTLRFLEALIENKADASAADPEGKTPLHILLGRCTEPSTQLVMPSEYNKEALAAYSKQRKAFMQIAKLLVEKGGVSFDVAENSPLIRAAETGNLTFLRYVINNDKLKVNYASVDEKGETFVHKLVRSAGSIQTWVQCHPEDETADVAPLPELNRLSDNVQAEKLKEEHARERERCILDFFRMILAKTGADIFNAESGLKKKPKAESGKKDANSSRMSVDDSDSDMSGGSDDDFPWTLRNPRKKQAEVIEGQTPFGLAVLQFLNGVQMADPAYTQQQGFGFGFGFGFGYGSSSSSGDKKEFWPSSLFKLLMETPGVVCKYVQPGSRENLLSCLFSKLSGESSGIRTAPEAWWPHDLTKSDLVTTIAESEILKNKPTLELIELVAKKEGAALGALLTQCPSETQRVTPLHVLFNRRVELDIVPVLEIILKHVPKNVLASSLASANATGFTPLLLAANAWTSTHQANPPNSQENNGRVKMMRLLAFIAHHCPAALNHSVRRPIIERMNPDTNEREMVEGDALPTTGYTLLHFLVQSKRSFNGTISGIELKTFETLLEKGANPNAASADLDAEKALYTNSDWAVTPLHLALSNFEVPPRTSYGYDPDASKFKLQHNPRIAILIKHGANPALPVQPSGETALHKSVSLDDPALIDLLLSRKADVNIPNKQQRTPLHLAAATNALAACEKLLANKADPNAVDEHKKTPLHIAAAAGHAGIVELQLSNKAEVNKQDETGRTALSFAASSRSADCVRAIVAAKKCDANLADNDGRTPLHWAAIDKKESEILIAVEECLIVDGKANVNALDKRGRSPVFYYLVNLGYSGVLNTSSCDPMSFVSALHSLGAKLDIADQWGRTLLSYAAQRSALGTSFYLCQNGANIDSLDNDKNSPLATALRCNHPDFAMSLLSMKASPSNLVHQVEFRRMTVNELIKELHANEETLADAEIVEGQEHLADLQDSEIAKYTARPRKTPEFIERKKSRPKRGKRGGDEESEYVSRDSRRSPVPFVEPDADAELGGFGAGPSEAKPKKEEEKKEDPRDTQIVMRRVDHGAKSMFLVAIEKGWQGVAYVLLGAGYNNVNAMRDCLAANKPQLFVNVLEKTAKAKVLKTTEDESILDLLAAANIAEAMTSKILNKLIDHGVDVELADSKSRTPLHFAARNHNRVMTTFLLERESVKARINEPDSEGVTPLGYALLAPLHHAASVNDYIRLLTENGATGKHSLLSLFKNEEVTCSVSGAVSFLIENGGAEVNLKDANGATPLMLALTHYGGGQVAAILQLLLQNGGDANDSFVDPTTKKRRIALVEAVRSHPLAVAEALLAGGAKVESADGEGMTPLMVTVKNNNLPTFLQIIRRIGDARHLNHKNEEGHTALSLALRNLSQNVLAPTPSAAELASALSASLIAKLLVVKGAACDVACGADGLSPLAEAVRQNRTDLVRLMLDPDTAFSQDKDIQAAQLKQFEAVDSTIIALLRSQKEGVDAAASEDETKSAGGRPMRAARLLAEERANKTKRGKGKGKKAAATTTATPTQSDDSESESENKSAAEREQKKADVRMKYRSDLIRLCLASVSAVQSLKESADMETSMEVDRSRSPSPAGGKPARKKSPTRKAREVEVDPRVMLLAPRTKPNVNVADAQGKTAVHHVVAPQATGSFENTAILRLLAANGAKLNVKDASGRSPMDYAVAQRSGRMRDCLVELGVKAPSAGKKGAAAHKASADQEEQSNVWTKSTVDFNRSFEEECGKIKSKTVPVAFHPDSSYQHHNNFKVYVPEEPAAKGSEPAHPYDALMARVVLGGGSAQVTRTYAVCRVQLLQGTSPEYGYVVITKDWKKDDKENQPVIESKVFGLKKDAIAEFKKSFRRKTGAEWNPQGSDGVKEEESDGEVSTSTRKYTYLPTLHVKTLREGTLDLLRPFDWPKCAKSDLPLPTQQLIASVMDPAWLKKQILDTSIDTAMLTLGDLNEERLTQAREILTQIQDANRRIEKTMLELASKVDETKAKQKEAQKEARAKRKAEKDAEKAKAATKASESESGVQLTLTVSGGEASGTASEVPAAEEPAAAKKTGRGRSSKKGEKKEEEKKQAEKDDGKKEKKAEKKDSKKKKDEPAKEKESETKKVDDAKKDAPEETKPEEPKQAKKERKPKEVDMDRVRLMGTVQANSERIVALTHKFYRVLPHKGVQVIDFLDSLKKVAERIKSVDLLSQLMPLIKIVVAAQAASARVHPLDYTLSALSCDITPLDLSAPDSTLSAILRHVQCTTPHATKKFRITNVFKIARMEDVENWKAEDGATSLLCKGLPKTDLANTILNGLPKQSTSTDTQVCTLFDMFEKGITDARPVNNEKSYVVLCEASLGTVQDLEEPKAVAALDADDFAEITPSSKGRASSSEPTGTLRLVGQTHVDENAVFVLPSGLQVPLGCVVPAPVEKPATDAPAAAPVVEKKKVVRKKKVAKKVKAPPPPSAGRARSPSTRRSPSPVIEVTVETVEVEDVGVPSHTEYYVPAGDSHRVRFSYLVELKTSGKISFEQATAEN